MSNENDRGRGERRGFLKALGLGVGVAATAPAVAQTATARKETTQERTAARYQPNSPHVQAFYRTNRGG